MQGQYNMRSPAVKRLMKEAQELRHPTELYHAQPLEDNLFEWHFTLRGPEESDFNGGIYHGRIILPPEYPMKPPSIILLTPNGRFETFKKICLSISGHHPESWQPSWSIRTALLAIIGFMPTHGGGAIGSLDYTPEERKVLARKSQDWKCPECGDVSQKLKPRTEASEQAAKEARELASQINFQGEKQGESQAKTSEGNTATTHTTPTTPSTPTTPPSTAPLPPPFPYPWAMARGWMTPNQASPATFGSVTVPRFPYPPPMMPPPPGLFMPLPQPGPSGQRFPAFPPIPFLPPGVREFPSSPAAGGTGGGTPGGAAAQAGSQASQSGSTPSQSTPSSEPSKPAPAPSPPTATVASPPPPPPPVSSSPPPPAAAPETVSAASPPAPSTTDTSATAAAASSANTPVSDSAAATSTTAAAAGTGISPAPSTELRQRSTTTTTTTTTTQPQVAPSPPLAPSVPASQRYSPGTVLMMVLLSLAITLLLARRVYLQYLKKDTWGPSQ